MKHLDFTIDFETCALTANAAPMQVAIVPWMRNNEHDPFCNEEEVEPYVGYVDLRSCVVDGFDFDPETVRWWSRQSEAAKNAVCEGLAEPVTDVLCSVLDYIRDIVEQYQLDSICLWCQGPDVDIAMLRSMCKRYDIHLEDTVPHTQFRDCRTLILEAAVAHGKKLYREMAAKGQAPEDANKNAILADPPRAYKLFDPLPEQYAKCSEAHDALYDAYRSSWHTWQALRWISL